MGSAMSNPKPLDFPYTDVIVAPVIEARRVRVADVDGEEFEEAAGGPFPCSGDESRKHRPRRVSSDGQIGLGRSLSGFLK